MTNHRTVRTATAGLAAAALTAVAVAAPSSAEGAQAAQDRPTSLAKVLAADGHHFDRNWGDFDILDAAVGAVLKADPDSAVGVLAKPRTRLTAFLPTDRAFRKLAFTLTGARPMTEKVTFRRLVRAAGVDTIEQVLLYHVVPGKTLGAKRIVAADGESLTTAQGGTVKVRVHGDVVRLADKDPDVANPKVIATNINKGNPQIAHAINGVLLPVDL